MAMSKNTVADTAYKQYEQTGYCKYTPLPAHDCGGNGGVTC